MGVSFGQISLAACGFKLRLCLLQSDLEIRRVKLYEQITLVNKLIGSYLDRSYICGDLRTYLNNVSVNKCVVGRFELSCVKPINKAAERNNKQSSSADIQKLSALSVSDRPLLRILWQFSLIGRNCLLFFYFDRFVRRFLILLFHHLVTLHMSRIVSK